MRGLALVLLACACAPELPDIVVDPFFPADVAEAWPLVRDCRMSIDHDSSYIVVHANPEAADAYVNAVYPLPDAAVIVKRLFADAACTDLLGYAVMKKTPSATATGGWRWQSAGADRVVDTSTDPERCWRCHELCTENAEGVARDGTCTDP